MGMISFNFVLSATILFIYGTIFVISLIFTLCPEAYRAIDSAVQVNLITPRRLTPLEKNIYMLDDWLMDNHQTVGPLLTLLSVVDLKLFLDIINRWHVFEV